MTKEDKIKEAYGGLIDLSVLDENGWAIYGCEDFSESGIEPFGEYETKNHIAGVYNWRPKSLQGIENNNGWIRIESENDLPKDKSIDVIVDSKPYQGFIYEANCGLFCCIENRYNQNELSEIIEANLITHYQPIFKPAIPLY